MANYDKKSPRDSDERWTYFSQEGVKEWFEDGGMSTSQIASSTLFSLALFQALIRTTLSTSAVNPRVSAL